MGKINQTLHLFKHYIGSAVSYICQFPIQILIGKKMYLIALMYLNAFKYETELQSMWNGYMGNVLLPQNYVFFLSDCFILGKKGYLLTVPKETEFPKSFFWGSVY